MTQVNWKKPLALAAVLFVLGTFAYWMEFKKKPADEAKESLAKKLFAIKDLQLESITIASGAKTFVLKCADLAAKLCKPGDNSKWELESPVKLRADDANVRSFVSTLDNISSAETIDLKDEKPEKRVALLRDYGLDPAALSSSTTRKVMVKAGGERPQEIALYLGAAHPIGDNFFAVRAEGMGAKPDETKVYLVASYFKSSLEKELTYWRDKKLFSLSGTDIRSFSMKTAKGQLTAERKDGLWTLTDAKKETYSGDIENIDSFLSSVAFLAAREFVSENKADQKAKAEIKGLKPVVTLTVQAEKKKDAKEEPAPITLTFLKRVKPEKLYATLSTADPLYELDPTALGRFEKELKDLRLNKLITSMERFTAKKIELAGGAFGAPLVLVNSDGKWLKEADKSEVDTEKVTQFLERISGNRIKEFLTGAAYPTGEQDGVRMTLGDEKNDKKRQYLFWKKSDKVYAKDLLSARKEAFGIDSSIKDSLPWSRNFFDKAEKPKETQKK